ncbi:MAG: ABC transporter ATP-binding protein [Clostridia bacterium]
MSVIMVKDVHKKFKVYYDKGQTFKEKLLFKNRNHFEDRWVLKGISFELEKGEAIGLIGENGSGKSTLLKLMTKIMYPDEGSIEIKGRVSSLIELGAGFHPDMSGKENIYTNASIFGLTKKEIDDRLNDIIEFSELEEFIDNPVRTYSSGMYMRLAFSVAINVDADVLLIDEILAVGDANFQAKCFDKLRELKASGITIVIVTHDTNTVEKFCNKAIWINEGVIGESGISTKVIDSYLNFMNNKKYAEMIAKQEKKSEAVTKQIQTEEEILNISEIIEEKDNSEEITEIEKCNVADKSEKTEIGNIDYNANRFGLKYIEIVNAEIRNKDGVKTTVVKSGEKVELNIYYKVNKRLEEYVFGMGFYTLDNICIFGTNTQLDRLSIPHSKNKGRVKFFIDKLPLLSGKYILQVAVVDQNGTPMDFYRDYCHFDVINSDRSVGIISINRSWEIE